MDRILISFLIGLVCCSWDKPETLETHNSSSGNYSINVELGNRANDKDEYILMLKLIDKNGNELDYIRTGASHVQRWAVVWYNEKVIVLNSSDIGTYAWVVVNGKLVQDRPISKQLIDAGEQAYKKKYGR